MAGSSGVCPGPGRALRRDAAANRDRLLEAAATAVRREGPAVPLATVAADAGVGVATLYRRYPSREDLLAALTARSFAIVLDTARRAAACDAPALDRLAAFLDETIEHGPELVLPLHGGPVPLDAEATALRAQVRSVLDGILRAGRQDGSIRRGVTAFDVVIFGALLAQPLPHVLRWRAAAHRQATIFLSGVGARPTPERPTT